MFKVNIKDFKPNLLSFDMIKGLIPNSTNANALGKCFRSATIPKEFLLDKLGMRLKTQLSYQLELGRLPSERTEIEYRCKFSNLVQGPDHRETCCYRGVCFKTALENPFGQNSVVD